MKALNKYNILSVEEISTLIAHMVYSDAPSDDIRKVMEYSLTLISTHEAIERCSELEKQLKIRELMLQYGGKRDDSAGIN